MVVTGGMNEWSLAVLIPAWRSSGLGRTQGEVRTGLQKDVIIAITSGSEPGSYSCPVSALHLLFTMACVLSLKSHEQRKKTVFFSLLFPAFCLTWWDVGLVSAKCWVRSVLVLCWHGCRAPFLLWHSPHRPCLPTEIWDINCLHLVLYLHPLPL